MNFKEKSKIIFNSQGGAIWVAIVVACIGGLSWTFSLFHYPEAFSNFWFWLLVIFALLAGVGLLYYYPKMIILDNLNSNNIGEKQENNNPPKDNSTTIEGEVTEVDEHPVKTPYNWLDSELYFRNSLAQAFPGDRGTKWYSPYRAVQRLRNFFEWIFENIDGGDPVWWRRGGQAESIKKVEVTDSNVIILGNNRIKISRMAVHVSQNYYKSFIYIEGEAEPPTGLYGSLTSEYKEEKIRNGGYLTEEYAEFRGRIITRNEYDDGACTLGDRIIPTEGEAKLRIRYITKFNCIITPKNSPYNCSRFNDSQMLFHEALYSEAGIENLFEYLDTFTKADMPESRSSVNIFQYDNYGKT